MVYWVVSWTRRLLSSGCSFGDGSSWALGGSGGRASGWAGGGRSGGRRAAGRIFNTPLVNAFLQRGLLNMGCCLGDGFCGALGALLETEAVEQWVLSWGRRLLSTGWNDQAVGRAKGRAFN